MSEPWRKNAAGVKDGADCYRTIAGVRWSWWAEDAGTLRGAGARVRRAPDGQGAFVHPDDEDKVFAFLHARATQAPQSEKSE